MGPVAELQLPAGATGPRSQVTNNRMKWPRYTHELVFLAKDQHSTASIVLHGVHYKSGQSNLKVFAPKTAGEGEILGLTGQRRVHMSMRSEGYENPHIVTRFAWIAAKLLSAKSEIRYYIYRRRYVKPRENEEIHNQ